MAFIRNTDEKYTFPTVENVTEEQLIRLNNELFPDGDMSDGLDGSLVDIIAVVMWIDEHVLRITSSYVLVSWCAPGWTEDEMDFTDPVIRDAHLAMDNTRLDNAARSAASAIFDEYAESPMEVEFGVGELVPSNLRGKRIKIAFMTNEESDRSNPGDFLAVSVDENGWLIGTPEAQQRHL